MFFPCRINTQLTPNLQRFDAFAASEFPGASAHWFRTFPQCIFSRILHFCVQIIKRPAPVRASFSCTSQCIKNLATSNSHRICYLLYYLMIVNLFFIDVNVLHLNIFTLKCEFSCEIILYQSCF